jgi:SAM-dependent methyltransferase
MLRPALRPAPFSRYTTDTLWTDPYIGRQMLGFHLDPAHDAASRRADTIDATVAWLDARFALGGKRLLDLGCGPGLYTTRMAARGCAVTGLDFSPSSIAHAIATRPAALDLDYIEADYLAAPLPGPNDLVTLIYGDFCTLSPDRRRTLLDAVGVSLAPGGRFIFDVYSPDQFAALSEASEGGHRYMGGFWAEGDYHATKHTLLYREPLISLEHYTVEAAERRFEVFNWMQYYTPESIAAELSVSGFVVEAVLEVETGEPWAGGATPFFVVAGLSA